MRLYCTGWCFVWFYQGTQSPAQRTGRQSSDAGGTDKVWFYDMKADGFSLDDKRSAIEANDIPDIIARFHNLEGEADRKPTEQSFLVDKSAIEANDYDLSINRYKEVVYKKVVYDAPEAIMTRLDELGLEISSKMEELRGLIGE